MDGFVMFLALFVVATIVGMWFFLPGLTAFMIFVKVMLSALGAMMIWLMVSES